MFFLDNPALYGTTSYGFLTPYQNLEKANDKIPRKHLDRRTHGQTEWRRDPITLPATPVGSNSRLTRLMFKVNSKSNRMISVDVDLVSTFLTLNKFCTVTHSRLMFHFYMPWKRQVFREYRNRRLTWNGFNYFFNFEYVIGCSDILWQFFRHSGINWLKFHSHFLKRLILNGVILQSFLC